MHTQPAKHAITIANKPGKVDKCFQQVAFVPESGEMPSLRLGRELLSDHSQALEGVGAEMALRKTVPQKT